MTAHPRSGKRRKTAPIFCMICLLSAGMQQQSIAQNKQIIKADTLHASLKGATAPLRTLTAQPPTAHSKQAGREGHFLPPDFLDFERPEKVNPDALPKGPDPLIGGTGPEGLLVEPRLIFDGIGESTNNVLVPDVNGDVGIGHYIEIVNASWFQVFDKYGIALTQPLTANTLWNQIGKSSFSDPVIQFDEVAGRWLITDLAGISEVLYGISQTSDPMGAWNLYSLFTPGFADYPKYGIWPTSYIFTVNEGFGDYPVYALNRSQMLAGAASVDIQRIDIPDIGFIAGFPTASPMDWNGSNPPPTNEVFVARMNDDSWGNTTVDAVEVWGISIDWSNPDNTIAVSTIIPTAPFDSDGCTNDLSVNGCIPQPNSPLGLDGIMTIIMNRIVYRNFGTHESAVLTFSVDADNSVSGIRWMELRRAQGQPWSLYQEGTVGGNDDVYRFLGSIAINSKGDIGLGYAVSGTNNYPSLRFTGRHADDPLGQMTVSEQEFVTGSGSRDGIGANRYGDYFAMTVDPVDDSFWFVGEYVKADGSYGTKITNFSLKKDSFDLAVTELVTPQSNSGLGSAEKVKVTVKNVGLMPVGNITVGYILDNGAPVTEAASVDQLAPDETYTHTFGSGVDMSMLGAYRFKLFSYFPGDQNSINDTLLQFRDNLPYYDLILNAVNNLDGAACSTHFNALLDITNNGTETVTEMTIRYRLNGGDEIQAQWHGQLQPGLKLSYPLMLTVPSGGNYHLDVSLTDPNGNTDQVPGNNAAAKDFVVDQDGVPVTLTLTFDQYPDETSWELQNQSGLVLFEGDNYSGLEEQTITVNWCLEANVCYDFVIYDDFNDGMTNNNGPDGSYVITRTTDGAVLASILNANFGSIEINPFCATPFCSVTTEIAVSNTTNGNNGAIMIQVTSGVSPFQYSIDGGEHFQSTPLFNGLAPGLYKIVVIDANNCTFNGDAQVFISVSSTQQQEAGYSILVLPNPSYDGIFKVQVSGMEQRANTLDVQVLNDLGKTMAYQSLPAINNTYRGAISLYPYPAGVYYLKFRNGAIPEMLKLIKL